MSVPDTDRKADHSCDGVATSFSFAFKVLEADDVKVILRKDNGDGTYSDSTLTKDAQPGYTVTSQNLDNGGNVNIKDANGDPYAYPSGYSIHIRDNTDFAQSGDYDSPLVKGALNNALDKLTILVQKLKRDLQRSVKFPEAESSYPADMPSIAEIKGKFLYGDVSTGRIIGADGISSVGVSAFIQTVLDDLSAEAARETLAVDKELELTVQDSISAGDVVSFDGSNFKKGVHYQDLLKRVNQYFREGGSGSNYGDGGGCLIEPGLFMGVMSQSGATAELVIAAFDQGRGPQVIEDNGAQNYTPNNVRYPSCATLDAANKKIVVVFKDITDTNHGTARVGQMADTGAITWGLETEFDTNASDYCDVCVLDATHFVVVWNDKTAHEIECRCGSVSGTTITWGSAVTFKALDAVDVRICALSASTFAVAWTISTGVTEARIGTVSGTTITAGASTYEVKSANADQVGIVALDSSTIIVFYEDTSATSGCAKLGSVSGEVISFEDEVTFFTDGIALPRACKIDGDHFILVFSEPAVQASWFVHGKRSTTTLIFGTATGWIYGTAGCHNLPIVDGSSFVCICCANDWKSNWTMYLMGMYLEGKKVGIAVENISASATGTVQVKGKVTGLNGLTAGSKYYRGPNGTLVTDGHEEDFMGVALSTTELLLC